MAQPNKTLCSELVDGLRRKAAQAGLSPGISRVGLNEAGTHPVTDHLEDYVRDQTKESLQLEELSLIHI